MEKELYLEQTQNLGHLLAHQPFLQVLIVHQHHGLHVHLHVITVADLHRVDHPTVPPELLGEEPALLSEHALVHVHRDAKAVPTDHREPHVSRRVSKGGLGEEFRNSVAGLEALVV